MCFTAIVIVTTLQYPTKYLGINIRSDLNRAATVQNTGSNLSQTNASVTFVVVSGNTHNV